MGQVENIMLADWWWGEAEYGVPLEDVRIPTRGMLRRGREVCEEGEREKEEEKEEDDSWQDSFFVDE